MEPVLFRQIIEILKRTKQWRLPRDARETCFCGRPTNMPAGDWFPLHRTTTMATFRKHTGGYFLALTNRTPGLPVISHCSAKFEFSTTSCVFFLFVFSPCNKTSFVAGMETREIPKSSSFKLNKVAFRLRSPFKPLKGDASQQEAETRRGSAES